MGAVTVQGFVCWCVFALPESPSDGGIAGLSNQQMQTAENNLVGGPRRGSPRGARLLREARITSNKESEHIHSRKTPVPSHMGPAELLLILKKTCEKCALHNGNKDVFQLLNSYDTAHSPLTRLFVLFWPGVAVGGWISAALS